MAMQRFSIFSLFLARKSSRRWILPRKVQRNVSFTISCEFLLSAKFCFCLSRCESKSWKFLVKIFRFFVIYVLLLLLLLSCITTILWAGTILVERAKKCWVNFFIFNFFIFHHHRGGVGKKKRKQIKHSKKKTQTHFHSANVELVNYFISYRIECEEENSVKEKTL